MRRSALSRQAGLRLILPEDCRLDPIPGTTDRAPWSMDIEDSPAWVEGWTGLTWEDSDMASWAADRRGILRIPQAARL